MDGQAERRRVVSVSAEVIDFEQERQDRANDPLLPPMDLDSEAALLSAIMLADRTALLPVRDFLKPEHYYSEAHRQIFAVQLELDAESKPIDIVQIAARLRDKNRLQQVGGMPYLTELLNAAPQTKGKGVGNPEEYGRTIYEKHRARELIAASQRIAAEGYHGIVDVQAWADDSAKRIGAIAQRSIGSRGETNLETLKRLIAELRDRAANPGQQVAGIRTGFPTLDKVLGGLHAGWKVTVCSLSNVGKTAFGMQVAISVARQGIGVQCFITESSRDEWFTRAMSQMAKVDVRKFSNGTLTPAEWNRLTTATLELSKLPIWIDATTDIHIGQVRSRILARAESAVTVDKVPLGLVVLDHVHRLEPAPEVRGKALREQLKHTTETFKGTLKRLKIPGLELAQMRDNPIDPKTKLRQRPGRGFVAECRYIEREADAVLYLHQRPMYNRENRVIGEDRRSVLGILDKVRSPDNDDIEFGYVVEESRFVDERGQVDDTIDPMLAVSRVYVGDPKIMEKPDPRLPPEKDYDETFSTEGL